MEEKDKKTISSRTLGILEELGIEYVLKGRHAVLKDHDSLSIQLTGEFKDSWMRWSTGDSGRGPNELIQYLVQIGTLPLDKVKGLDLIEGKKVKVPEPKPFDYQTMVTNPKPVRAKYYLEQVRKLSPSIINRFFKLGKVVQDGRDNIRFLWELPGRYTGADVQGTTPDPNSKRGYIKYAVAGSQGLFYVKGQGVSDLKDVDRIYLFEAPIDLMSYLEMASYQEEKRLQLAESLPTLEGNWIAFSLSGAEAKLPKALCTIQKYFGIDLTQVHFMVATDNDESGEKVYTRLLAEGLEATRVLPNLGRPHLLNQSLPIKDWNDLLKVVKS